MTEDVELRPPVSVLTGRAYLGHPGIAEWLRDVDESFSSAQIVLLELLDFGAKVLALTEFRVEGRGEPAPARLGAWAGLRRRATGASPAGSASSTTARPGQSPAPDPSGGGGNRARERAPIN